MARTRSADRIHGGERRNRDAEAVETSAFQTGDPARFRGRAAAATPAGCAAIARAEATGTFSQSKVTTSTAAREAGELLPVVECAGDDFGDCRARHVRTAVVHRELEAERDAGQGHHPAELAGADDTDAHGRASAGGRIRPREDLRGLPLAERRERVAQRRVLARRGSRSRGGRRYARRVRRSRPSRPARRRASARSRAASRARSAPSTGSARR